MYRVLIVFLILLSLSVSVWAVDYTITTSGTNENTVQFFATYNSVTATAALQEICDAGLAVALLRRTEIDAAAARAAFDGADPENAAAICALLCLSTPRYVCPGFTCP